MVINCKSSKKSKKIVLIKIKNLKFVVNGPYCFYTGKHNTVEKQIKGKNGFRGVAVFYLKF